MSERTVTLKGNTVALAGPALKTGEAAPDCELVDNGLAPVKLSSYKGKVTVLCSVPSLDTPVCDLEMKRFNQEAVKLGDAVRVVCVSTDLPFAQKRWCGATGASAITALSDHREAAFGKAYGVLIPSLRILARAVFVVDKGGILRHVQIVPEVASEPDYKAALDAVAKAV
mgnify:CR=1 FL=1